MPYLKGEAIAPREFVFCEDNYQIMMRSPTHKMVYHTGQEAGELYDLEADPHEMVNLAFPSELPDDPSRITCRTTSDEFRPWPPLPPHLDEVRRELLAKMWRFAIQENDIIFSPYPPVALAPYGPVVGLRRQ